MPNQNPETPKDKIEIGSEINGWTVIRRLPAQNGAGGETGSFFSRGYFVRNEKGHEAFLKAMDYITASCLYPLLEPFERMQQIANDIAFEKRVAQHCRKLNRVINALDAGSLNSSSLDEQVEYIIFEKAEGNIRKFVDFSKDLDVVFILKALHNTCVGINQLHSRGMFHEDIKPSNIMIMGDDNRHTAKLGDLGRIVVKNPGELGIVKVPAHFSNPFPGEGAYDPPESQYCATLALDEFTHRKAVDLFQFGSMVYFCFVNTSMAAALKRYTHADHQPGRKEYFEALPYLQAALGAALNDLEELAPPYLAQELVQMVKELCNPDYRLRGHPGDIKGKHIDPSLHRYHSILSTLLRKAMMHVEKSTKA